MCACVYVCMYRLEYVICSKSALHASSSRMYVHACVCRTLWPARVKSIHYIHVCLFVCMCMHVYVEYFEPPKTVVKSSTISICVHSCICMLANAFIYVHIRIEILVWYRSRVYPYVVFVCIRTCIWILRSLYMWCRSLQDDADFLRNYA